VNWNYATQPIALSIVGLTCLTYQTPTMMLYSSLRQCESLNDEEVEKKL
jgi:hypothetical protein